MAQKATIFKVTLQLADMDRNYYQDLQLTLARHPSETDERMMLRILAYALNATENLQFCKGISTDDEPDIWEKTLSGEIECWIELGLPDEKRLRKACARANKVVLYTYGGNAASLWWQGIENKLSRFDNLSVIDICAQTSEALVALVQRSMRLQCTVQDGQIWLGSADESIFIEPRRLR